MRIWLGAYEWQREHVDGLLGWFPPAGSHAVLDFRPLADQARQGGLAPMATILLSDDAVDLPNGIQLASDPDEFVTAARRNELRVAMQSLNPLSSMRLMDLLWECLTLVADPDGLRSCPPLMPSGRTFELFLGPWHHEEPFDLASPSWPLAQAMYQRLYRQIRADTLAGIHRAGFHREMLSGWCERLGVDLGQYALFVPPDLPREQALPHSTTLTESFNTADSTTLGPDQTWTEFQDGSTSGDAWDILTNRGRQTFDGGTNGSSARVGTDLASADHYAQLLCVDMGPNSDSNSQLAGAVRFSATAVTFYGARLLNLDDTLRLMKLVSGTLTGLGTPVTVTIPFPDFGDTVKTEINGSTLKSFLNAVQKESITDTAITGGTRTGFWGYKPAVATTILDTWEAADLAVAATEGGGPRTFAAFVPGFP